MQILRRDLVSVEVSDEVICMCISMCCDVLSCQWVVHVLSTIAC